MAVRPPLRLCILATLACLFPGHWSVDARAQQQNQAQILGQDRSGLKARRTQISQVTVGQTIKSREDLVVIDNEESDMSGRRKFRVLFGSLTPEGNSCADDPAACSEAEGVLRNADPEWQVVSGFAMIRGWRPRARTNRVTTASNGTTFFIQIDQNNTPADEADDIQRIVLVEISDGEALKIYERKGAVNDPPDDLTSEPVLRELSDPFTFVEVTRDANGNVVVSQPMAFPAVPGADEASQLRKLVKKTLARPLAKDLD
ncbi:MAG: hypothetical protein SFZ24_02375 [Planctomycetota bacterium]|nr:hypothetical protein [Planctomycetota bacterium]